MKLTLLTNVWQIAIQGRTRFHPVAGETRMYHMNWLSQVVRNDAVDIMTPVMGIKFDME